jgi:predicted PurR-regulated permease PerM
MNDITLKKIIKLILWAAGIILFLFLLYLLSDLVTIIAISFLLFFIFEPLVIRLEKNGLNRLSATLIVFIVVGFLGYLFLSFIIPRLTYQMNQLMTALKEYSSHENMLEIEKEIYRYFPVFSPGELSKTVEGIIDSQKFKSIESIPEILSGIVSVIAVLVIVPFITFFLIKDSRKIFRSFLQIMPNKYFEMSYWIVKRIRVQLGRFVRSWIFDATFVGVSCGLGFYLIGIENALPLGIIAGIGHLVPYFGPIIGGIPAAILSISQYGNLSKIPLIAVLLTIIYLLDNGFVQPVVFSKGVNMHPIAIILLIIAGSQLFGIIGMLLAIPVATVIKTAAKEIYFAFKNYKIVRT